jgi:hypothetical protein
MGWPPVVKVSNKGTRYVDHSEKGGVGSDAGLGLGFADQLPRQVEWIFNIYIQIFRI